MGDPPKQKTDRPSLPLRVHASSYGPVTTNACEIADFAAMHKRKLREATNRRQTVSFAQQRAWDTPGFAKPLPDG